MSTREVVSKGIVYRFYLKCGSYIAGGKKPVGGK